MYQPIIGITGAHYETSHWSPKGVGARRSYIDAIIDAGGIPLVLPPVLAAQHHILEAYIPQLDGLLLPGGGDIDPALYDAPMHPKTTNIDAYRDYSEIALTRMAIQQQLPILGICRGLQVINVALGGTMIQDIPDQVGGPLAHGESITREDWEHMPHSMQIADDSLLARLLGTTSMPVNSLHHQALGTIGQGIRAVAWSDDGVIEAVEGTGSHFLLAVQCHPEALYNHADTRWQQMFGRFIDNARHFAQQRRSMVPHES
jgi:putative glutamine amidotransferase